MVQLTIPIAGWIFLLDGDFVFDDFPVGIGNHRIEERRFVGLDDKFLAHLSAGIGLRPGDPLEGCVALQVGGGVVDGDQGLDPGVGRLGHLDGCPL